MAPNRRDMMAAGAATVLLGARPALARDATRYDAVLDAAFADQAPVALAGAVTTRVVGFSVETMMQPDSRGAAMAMARARRSIGVPH